MVKQVEENSLDLSGLWTAKFIMTQKLRGSLYGDNSSISDVLIALWNTTDAPGAHQDLMDQKKLSRFLNTSEQSKEKIFDQIKSKLKITGNESTISFLAKFKNTDVLKTIYHNFMTVSAQSKLGFTDSDLIQFAINISEDSGAEFFLNVQEVKKLYKEKISPLLGSLDFNNEEKSIFRSLSTIYNEIFRLAKECGIIYSWKSGDVADTLNSLFSFRDGNFFPQPDFITIMEDDPKNVALLSKVFNQWEASNFSSNLVKQERQNLYNSRILSSNYTKNALIGYRQFHKVLPVTPEVRETETSETIQSTQSSRFLKNISSFIRAYDAGSSSAKELLNYSISGLSSFLPAIDKKSAEEIFKEPNSYQEAIHTVCTNIVNVPQVKAVLAPDNKEELKLSDELYDSIFDKVSTGKKIDSDVKLAFWNILWLLDCLEFYKILFSVLPKGARTEEDLKKIFEDASMLNQYKGLVKQYIDKSAIFDYVNSNGRLAKGTSYIPTAANLGTSDAEFYKRYSSLFSATSQKLESLLVKFTDNPIALEYLKSLGVSE